MANLRTIGARLRLLVGDYKRDVKEAEHANTGLQGSFRETSLKGKADLDRLAVGAATVGTAMLALAATSIVSMARFDKQMSEVKSVAGATVEEMDRLREAAIRAGEATVFSATEAAQAEAELAKAGISAADILGGALTGSLSLAAAGSLDLATSAEIAANAMNTFGLEGSDVTHIADVLAAAANKSSAGVEDLGLGLQQVGLVAAQVGLTLEETVGLLAAFADRGLKGSDGATSLKTALMRLAAPTGKAGELMDKLGISLYDANGNMLGAVDIAGQLEGALRTLTPEQRNAAMQTIFGSDAIRAANVLYNEGAAGIEEYIRAVDDQGAASDAAATKLDNLAGDVEALKGSLETLFIQSGSGANGGLRFLTQAGDRLVGTLSQIPAPLLATGTGLLGIGGASLLAAAGALKAKRILDEMEASLGGAATMAGRATGKFRGLAAAAGKIAIAIAVVTLAIEALDQLGWLEKIPLLGDAFHDEEGELRGLTTTTGKLARQNRTLNSTMDSQLSSGRKLIDMWEELHGQLVTADEAALDANRAIEEIKDTFDDDTKSIKGNSTAVLENRVALESAARKAAEAAQAYLEHTGDVDGAAKMMGKYKDEAIKATGATGNARQAIADFAKEIFALPPSKTITIKINASAQLNRVQAELARFDAQFRWGGLTMPAQSGLLRQAGTFAAASPARYAFAEPATQGEAFEPRRGDYGRSMGILSEAAGWYGADVVPGGRGGGWYGDSGAMRVEVTVRPAPGASRDVMAAITEGLRYDVRTVSGGDVSNHLTRRR